MIDKKLIDEFAETVRDIVNTSYALLGLTLLLNDEQNEIAHIANGVTSLSVKVLDNATDVLWSMVDAIGRESEGELLEQSLDGLPEQHPGEEGDRRCSG